MFFKRKKETKQEQIAVRCRECKDVKTVVFEELKVRAIGYKGKFQIYTCCKKCGAYVTVYYEELPGKMQRKLCEKYRRYIW